ncbi:MAG: HAD hydrolase-like protein [Gemmatimonadales bacterium]|nr:HAD hydrolase-like protein [Gemmatimonadales bacterium]NIN10766.1 HAD hydrolase-like protein [Gemmatimonadales bacterium]NIQ98996.1 HAD hydrolase-like protein [Gemmatimonadales bacterium]NIS63815.1 HAD hydrolase-like protein [Gemmatimonadales bacterium]
MERLVLFDIDGTLIWTAGAGREAIRHALLAEMGATGPIDGYRFHGKTDLQIIVELMQAAGHPHAESDHHIAAVCRRYVELLGGELEKRRGAIHVHPGVLELLDLIEARGDTLLGLLTGNLADGAALKLQAAGINPARFRVAAYGSDSAERPELSSIAAQRAAPLMGRVPQGEEIVIVGDTPADMTCGQSVGARAIGVATGPCTIDELWAAGAFAAFDSFADVGPVLEAIYA